MKKAIQAIIILSFVLLFVFLLNVGITKSEQYDCMTWQRQAQQFDGFYLTKWQAKQCEAHNIIINTDVK